MENSATTVMLVDDDQQVLKAVKAILAEEGYRVVPYHDPLAALSDFKAGEYDLVISDIKMPQMTGVELLEHLRELEPELPVILHTGYAELETAVNAVKGDAFDYLIKPVDPEILVKVAARASLFHRYSRMEKNYLEGLKDECQATNAKLFDMVHDLEKALAEAQAASRLKSEILANMSHELRTPLNGVIGLSQVLLDTEHSPQVTDFLRMIEKSALALNTMLNNLLELSDLLSGPMSVAREEIDLKKLLLDLGERYQDEAKARGLRLYLASMPGVPEKVAGDGRRLDQVLRPLLDNALKFTEHGEISLLVAARPIGAESIELDFVVKDSGIGIASEKQSEIFESFRQADGSFTRRHGGAGLGLAIAQKAASLLGGAIRVESSPEQGATFTASIPFVRPVMAAGLKA